MTTETEQQNQIPQYTELGWIPQCENRIGKVDNIRCNGQFVVLV